MPRNGSGVYSAPAGTKGVTQLAIESAKYNAFVDDLVAEANNARPITAGGTGGATLSDARTNLGIPDLADEAKAVAGENNTDAMTPLRTRQAIDARLPVIMLQHYFESGDTDYAPAANRAIAVLGGLGGGELYIPNGDWTATSETITLDEPGVSIVGPGCLMDATIHVGTTFTLANADSDNLLFNDARISCRMKCSTESTTRTAIEVQYVRGFKIQAHIENYNTGISALAGNDGEVFGQMTARIDVSGSVLVNCLNPILGVRNTTGPTLQHADWTVVGVTIFNPERALRSIDFEGLDGLVLSGTYMFMPGRNRTYTNKRQNVRLSRSTNLQIVGNQFFEPGAEFIHLDRCQSWTITGNGMYYGGQVVPSAAIRITGGDTAESEFCLGYIGGNNGLFTTGNFVDIEDNCGYITVAPNQFREPGATSYYYGTDPLPSTIYGINAGASTTRIDADAGGITRSTGFTALNLLGTVSSGLFRSGELHYASGASGGFVASRFASLASANRAISWQASSPEGNLSRQPGSLVFREGGGPGITAWVKESGSGNTGWLPIQTRTYGTTAQRPAMAAGAAQTGFEYYDTTLGKPIWYTGSGSTWKDAAGTTV